jgi:predicted hotdog family 3-hydroxylacyl-ACP dehydratase
LSILGFIEILIDAIKVHRSRTLTRSEQTAIFTGLLSASRFVSVVAQYFEVQVYDQFAIRGNAAIFKCQVPSFVADHVDVVGWIDSNGGSYVADEQSYGS